MKISLCMIVWNEADLLPQAVNSARSLADEIIIVDTGSNDNTIKVARSLNAKVLVGVDRMHKGNARNIAQENATGDWIVILDADEKIADPTGLRQFLEKTDAQAVYVKLAFMDGDKETLSYPQMRCWRRGAYEYKYRAHEIPVPFNGWGEVAYTDFVFEHRPPGDRTWKKQYTLDRLLLDVQENPGDARPVYYLGRQYMYCGQYEEAAKTLDQYIEMAPGGRDVADAYQYKARCYAQLDDAKKQKESLFLACSVQPERREFWGQLAELYRSEGNQSLAAGLLKCALEIPKPEGLTYTTHSWYGAHIYDTLARCLWKLQRYDEGKKYAQLAAQLEPENERLTRNLLFFEDVTQERAEVVTEESKEEKPIDKRLLFLTLRDNAGVAYKYAQAVNGLDGCAARSVVHYPDYFQYPKDVFLPTEDELKELLDWCDAVFVFDDYEREGIDKPLSVIYTGSYYRQNFEACNLHDKLTGVKQFCTTIDLEQYGAEWLPVPMAPMAFGDVVKNEEFTVVHAPTVRIRKGTAFVEKLQGVKIDIIENVTNAECLRRKVAGHVLVDQFELGYGVNALEAWALGLPVVADATEEIYGTLRKKVGYAPFMICKPESLQDTIDRLRFDSAFRDESQNRGVEYLAEYHNPAKVAEKIISTL